MIDVSVMRMQAYCTVLVFSFREETSMQTSHRAGKGRAGQGRLG